MPRTPNFPVSRVRAVNSSTGETIVQGFCQGALDKSIQFRIFTEKGVCMAGVGTESLQAVGDQLAEASDILVFCGKNAGDIAHGFIFRHGLSGFQSAAAGSPFLSES